MILTTETRKELAYFLGLRTADIGGTLRLCKEEYQPGYGMIGGTITRTVLPDELLRDLLIERHKFLVNELNRCNAFLEQVP